MSSVNSEWWFIAWDRLRVCNLVNLHLNPKWWQFIKKDYVARIEAQYGHLRPPKPEEGTTNVTAKNDGKEKEVQSTPSLNETGDENTDQVPVWFMKYEQPDALLYILDFMKRNCRNLRILELPSHATTKSTYMASLPPCIHTLRMHYASNSLELALQGLEQSHLPLLHTLDLVRSLIKNKELAHLPRNLLHLSLEGSFLLTGADGAFATLPPSLQSLSLAWCSAVSSSSLAHLPQSLTSLDLSNCSQLYGAALTSLPSSLKYLNVMDCNQITQEGYSALPTSLQTLISSNLSTGTLPPTLTTLHLSSVQSNEPLLALPSALKTLTLSNTGITDEGLGFLPPSLEVLNIYDCPKITSQGLGVVIKELKLKRLSLKSTSRNTGHMYRQVCSPEIDDELLQYLPQSLKELEVQGTQISPAALRKCSASLPSLSVYYYPVKKV